MSRPLIVVLSFALVALSCATSPTGKSQLHLVSDGEMAKMGEEAYEQLKEETPVTKDEQVTDYVNCVADAITAELDDQTTWEVNVFDDDKQVNAFALPGGNIGVYTGLLKVADDQSQLASVIGHEVGHVLANINIPAVGYGADHVVAFVHAAAEAEHVLGLGLLMLTRKGVPLHPFRRLDVNQAQQSGCQVHEIHQAVALGAGFVFLGGQVTPFRGEVHHHRD